MSHLETSFLIRINLFPGAEIRVLTGQLSADTRPAIFRSTDYILLTHMSSKIELGGGEGSTRILWSKDNYIT